MWDLTSYWDIPKPRRAEILTIIGKGFERELAARPREEEKAQRTETLRRQTAARDAHLSSQMKKLLQFRRYKHLRLYDHVSRDEFRRQWELAGPASGHGITEKNRLVSSKTDHPFDIQ